MERKVIDISAPSLYGQPQVQFRPDDCITYNTNAWKESSFVSAAKGQEFVFDTNDNVIGWVKNIILSGK